jgi:folylpolyglutamate synthase/dihydropteroate synthase
MPLADLEAVSSLALGQDVVGFSDFRAGLLRAQELASELDGMVVVTGSITLVGDVIKLIQEESDAK